MSRILSSIVNVSRTEVDFSHYYAPLVTQHGRTTVLFRFVVNCCVCPFYLKIYYGLISVSPFLYGLNNFSYRIRVRSSAANFF